jgi:hypothetical protein
MSLDTLSLLGTVILLGVHLSAAREPGLGGSGAVVQCGANDVAVQIHTAVLRLLHQLAEVVHCSAVSSTLSG